MELPLGCCLHCRITSCLRWAKCSTALGFSSLGIWAKGGGGSSLDNLTRKTDTTLSTMKLEDLPHPEDGAADLEIPGYPRRRWLRLIGMCAGAVGLGGAANYWVYPPPIPPLMFDGRFAHARPEHPPVIHSLVLYCNQIQGQPYKWGGGHRYLYDNGFDCSGSISHVLFRAGLLTQPLNSTHFANYGHPGPGKYVSLFIRPGHHVFMSVCGFRFDTTGGREGEGPAWRIRPRDPRGFINRHPPGL